MGMPLVHDIPEHELRQMYCYDGMSQRKIAEAFGVDHATVSERMKLYGIESRTISESRMLNLFNISKEELEKMYIGNNMSASEIGDKFGVSQRVILYRINSYGIEVHTQSQTNSKFTGENAHNWQGGTSFKPYCKRFNNQFKEAVRVRDDYTCQLCGYEQKPNGQKLSVHHIHYDKENCYPDVVALCRSCNGRVNGNRDYREQHFESQLLERGLFCWSINSDKVIT